jgi:tetratricopeptide (TPR) repeat protein
MYAACVSLLIDSAVSYPLRLWPTAATFFAFAGALAAANSTERTVRVEGAVPRIAIGAVVAICGWSCFSSMASTVMSELQSARGIEAFERGDTDTAMRDLERAVRRQPRNGRAHFFLGLCLAQQRLYDEAISEMRIALTTYRRQAIYLELGKAHEKTGNAVEAQRFLDAAVLMFPRDAEAWNTKGAFLSGRGDAAGAAACFRRALSLTPSSFDAARNLAVSCQAAGMDDEALRAYERAIALKPGLAADLYVNMGAILAVRGDTTGARLLWEKALSIDPGNTDAQENLRRLNSH